jgi:2,3-bisphosphoglycerate-independent phosphoglycerate mutase
MITADHGNAEQMKDPEKGTPFTAHTTNVVPLIMTGDPKVLRFKEEIDRGKDSGGGVGEAEKKDSEAKDDGQEEEGALCDVAPTILDVMVCVSHPS